MSSIIHQLGDKTSPLIVLHRTLEKIDDIESLAIVIKKKNGDMQVDWSTLAISTMCMMATALDIMTRREMEESYELDSGVADKH